VGPVPDQLALYWRNPGEEAWRDAREDPPPADPAVLEWLYRRRGESDWSYGQRARLLALPSHRAPQRGDGIPGPAVGP
jgi:hypothetical protein